MVLSCNFFSSDVKYAILIVLFFPCTLLAQLPFQKKYKSKFEQGIYVESLLGKNVSVNYNKNFNITDYGFFSASGGLAYVFGYAHFPGGPNPWLYYNSGLGIPLNLTYNMSLGSIDNMISSIFSRSCYKKPPKFNLDFFLEAGVGATPSFYKNKNRNGYFPSAYGGGRLHLFVRRPYKEKDILLYMRGGIKPYMYNNYATFNYTVSIGTSI